MSLFSNCPFTKLSVYGEDYKSKVAERRPLFRGVRDYDDPVAGPYTEYLLPVFKYKQLKDPQTEHHPQDYLERLLNRKPDLKRYFHDPPVGPPNFDIIDSLYDGENRTIYMIDFCKKHDFDSKKKRSRQFQILPDDWYQPATTQRASYRDPKTMAPGGIVSSKVSPQPENLRPSLTERRILQIKTGDSEYMGVIGACGQGILDDKLFGDINVRPKFDEEDLLKAKIIAKHK